MLALSGAINKEIVKDMRAPLEPHATFCDIIDKNPCLAFGFGGDFAAKRDILL